MRKLILPLVMAAFVSACASYTTPGAGVSLAGIQDADLAEIYARKPEAQFPARLALARVASPRHGSGYGTGRFSLMTARDIETEADIERLNTLPQLAALAPLTRLLIPGELNDIRALRNMAAQTQADLLLVYTVDTVFRTEKTQLGPLQTIGLGFFPTNKAMVTSTVSFIIVDVRSGYLYGAGETTASEDQRSNVWGNEDAIERARTRAESRAFTESVTEVQTLWNQILAQHNRPSA